MQMRIPPRCAARRMGIHCRCGGGKYAFTHARGAGARSRREDPRSRAPAQPPPGTASPRTARCRAPPPALGVLAHWQRTTSVGGDGKAVTWQTPDALRLHEAGDETITDHLPGSMSMGQLSNLTTTQVTTCQGTRKDMHRLKELHELHLPSTDCQGRLLARGTQFPGGDQFGAEGGSRVMRHRNEKE